MKYFQSTLYQCPFIIQIIIAIQNITATLSIKQKNNCSFYFSVFFHYSNMILRTYYFYFSEDLFVSENQVFTNSCFQTNINIQVLITRHQFSEKYHFGPKNVIQLLFFNQFGVNHQDLVVGENDAARVYVIPEIKIHPIYISPSINNIKYYVVKNN